MKDEIKLTAKWWRDQVELADQFDEDRLDVFEEQLRTIIVDQVLTATQSVSLACRDKLPPQVRSAARLAGMSGVKKCLKPCTFSRTQPGEVLVQIGDHMPCKNIFLK